MACQLGTDRSPGRAQLDVVVAAGSGDVAEPHRRRLGDGATQRRVRSVVVLQRFGEPRPCDDGQHLVAELLAFEAGLYEADEPEGALPGVLARGVVQEDEAPGGFGLVEVLR